jgi:hypothetical protein
VLVFGGEVNIVDGFAMAALAWLLSRVLFIRHRPTLYYVKADGKLLNAPNNRKFVSHMLTR